MGQRIWGQAPALTVAAIALFVAMGGSVYAAKQARIDGKTVRAKSLPGNRVVPRSLPGNRLRPNSIGAGQLKKAVLRGIGGGGQLTGAEINELTLGQVPSAVHAERADVAQSATDAQTALNAVNAIDAKTVNGHSAGCLPGTLRFAGACWQSSPHGKATAPNAARHCTQQGGSLPGALELAAFAEEPGVNLHEDDEWSGDITNVSGLNLFSVVTVSPGSEINFNLSTNTRAYRCVIPLLT